MNNKLAFASDQKLKKKELLKSKKFIDLLFKEGKSFFIYPIRVVIVKIPPMKNIPVKVLFSVPGHKFKKATRRNYLKRIMREAYRKNNQQFQASLDGKNYSLAIALIYAGTKPLNYHVVEEKIIEILNRLIYLSGDELPGSSNYDKKTGK